jgi:hypothetical protein
MYVSRLLGFPPPCYPELQGSIGNPELERALLQIAAGLVNGNPDGRLFDLAPDSLERNPQVESSPNSAF